MKKSKSNTKPRARGVGGGSMGRNFFSVKPTNANKGADQDLQLALALSISELPKDCQEDNVPPKKQEVENETKNLKRKRVLLDKMEVPTLLVTTENDYKAYVMRKAHNLLNISSNTAGNELTPCDTGDHYFWSLSSLSEISQTEDFLINSLKQVDTPAITSQLETESFTLIYKSDSSHFSSTFSNFLFNPFLSDTVIVTKDSYKIPSHLFILAAHSSLIRELIAERYSMKRILMKGHEIQAVIPLLEFMYLGKFEFESCYLEKVRRLACVLQMELFLKCLVEHERISNQVKEKNTDCENVQNSFNKSWSSETHSTQSQNLITNLFSKATKDASQ